MPVLLPRGVLNYDAILIACEATGVLCRVSGAEPSSSWWGATPGVSRPGVGVLELHLLGLTNVLGPDSLPDLPGGLMETAFPTTLSPSLCFCPTRVPATNKAHAPKSIERLPHPAASAPGTLPSSHLPFQSPDGGPSPDATAVAEVSKPGPDWTLQKTASSDSWQLPMQCSTMAGGWAESQTAFQPQCSAAT